MIRNTRRGARMTKPRSQEDPFTRIFRVLCEGVPHEAGFAPTFLFVYDETWQLMEYAMQQLSQGGLRRFQVI